MVKIANQSSDHLVRIINDILDVEKIDSGGLELRIEPVPIGQFLEQALAANEGFATKCEISLKLEEPPAGATVAADPNRLLQVKANLLSNACKFSPPGAEVWVRVRDYGTSIRVEV